jgi:hypothetical protein
MSWPDGRVTSGVIGKALEHIPGGEIAGNKGGDTVAVPAVEEVDVRAAVRPTTVTSAPSEQRVTFTKQRETPVMEIEFLLIVLPPI